MKQRVLHTLFRIEIAVFVLSVIAAMAYTVSYVILPRHGINVDVHSSGTSMLPAIKDGSFTVWVDAARAPFEEVEVGDVIIFWQRTDFGVSHTTFTINNTKVGSTAETEEPTEEKPVYVDEGIRYKNEGCMHRVIEIVDSADRAVFTKGDNNSGQDPYPVMRSGYRGKVVWTVNYLGWPLRILILHNGLIWLLAFDVLLIPVAVMYLRLSKKEN